MIPDETLTNCNTNNPDGVGFMYRDDNNQIIISKGYDLPSTIGELKKLNDYDVCIHFRYATHGAVSGGNCHPFPVSNSVYELQRTDNMCNIGLAHNGIIAGFPPSKEISDTMQFILSLPHIPEDIVSTLEKTFGKFCLMTADHNYLFGEFVEDMGCYFSNDGYVEAMVHTTYSYGGKSYQYKDYSYLDESPTTLGNTNDMSYDEEEEICKSCRHYTRKNWDKLLGMCLSCYDFSKFDEREDYDLTQIKGFENWKIDDAKEEMWDDWK